MWNSNYRCDMCRYWMPLKRPIGTGECELARGIEGGPTVIDSLAFARDDEQMYAELVTLPAFGCVQWRAK